MSRTFLSLLLLSFLATFALGGPNEGGVLLVHYSAGTLVPGEPTFVEGGLTACDSAVVQAPADSTILWHVYAAFPPASSPRVKVVSFGCEFDENEVGILWSAARAGAIEIKYEQLANWPFTGSGTAIAFAETLTGTLSEIYAFAGYGPDGGTFSVVAHPDSVLGGSFADDGTQSELDRIADYGALGFAAAGIVSCPAVLDEDVESGDIELEELPADSNPYEFIPDEVPTSVLSALNRFA